MNGFRNRQRGASAVEFALVFPMLFAITYVTVVYSYLFIIHQSLSFAAQEAAEAAVSIDPRQNVADYRGDVEDIIRRTVESTVRWLPEGNRDLVLIDEPLFCGAGGSGDAACPLDGGDAVIVKVRLRSEAGNQIFAQLQLPYFEQRFPPLPEIRSQAVARL